MPDVRRYDVIILGSGLVGCLTALHLKRAKLNCAIVDAYTLYHGASIHNAGGLYFQLQPDAAAFGIAQRQSLQLLAGLLRPALEAWHHLGSELGELPGVHFKSGIIAATSEEEMASLVEKNKLEKSWGITTEILSARQTKTLLPQIHPDTVGGSFSLQEGFCETELLRSRILSELRELKIPIFLNQKPVHLEFHEDEVSLLTQPPCDFEARGHFIAKELVSCVGSETGALLAPLWQKLRIKSPVQSLPLQVLRIQGEHVDSDLIPLFVRSAGTKLSLKQLPNKDVLIGGGWSALADLKSPVRVEWNPESTLGNLELAYRFFPSLRKLSAEPFRGGRAAWTQDGLPILGRSTSLRSLSIACGGNGFTLAPLSALVLAQTILRKKIELDLTPFHPDRFSTTNSPSSTLPPDG